MTATAFHVRFTVDGETKEMDIIAPTSEDAYWFVRQLNPTCKLVSVHDLQRTLRIPSRMDRLTKTTKETKPPAKQQKDYRWFIDFS